MVRRRRFHASGGLDTPAAEVMGPSWSAQHEASSFSSAFDWHALHPAVTGPQHTTAMSQASILTFDEGDTGPEWLLQRGVCDRQIVITRNVAYHVVTRQCKVSGLDQSQLYLNPLFP
ncbi:hypothetical protein PD5205_00798 [Xanthomonas fragariae]|uniref:Uncharacterized protein n=1 Tax=Xanthomonas fragariae TaxID=48664 RepID=A0A1Y6GZK4_9XANT|nr:hypothetical protein BER92_03855 [Xanthomonas fragariae]ENZ94099.1 hypothetical protein O1K_16943 [Xanthomonas fragariae LMG 25863]SMQ96527.1 hypothetical protein NBC2815_03207 [Xanthomonas fragariae]SMR00434.1 hypothetical protein PD885_03213 [Xanthomonas fragariae]SMR02118.1 hypothetical protein PD5205_00798 [Xanthomonas fragariae]